MNVHVQNLEKKEKKKKDTVPLESVSIRYRALGLAALDPQTYSL